ncbi:MAG: DUF1854 domain-containing protein [Burkholderiales bacterium]|nr:DUF1854 domain-containing protein [Burkholderiales bacterium]
MNASSNTQLVANAFELSRNSFGKLVLTTPDGQTHEDVVPVRAFPIQSPDRGISLLNNEGHEVAWVDALADVPQPAQGLIREALGGREFMPEIQAILSVTSFATPCTWQVLTDRGETNFVLRGDEDIRRLAGNTLLVTDSHGIHFLIRDLSALSRDSRRILDRFM